MGEGAEECYEQTIIGAGEKYTDYGIYYKYI